MATATVSRFAGWWGALVLALALAPVAFAQMPGGSSRGGPGAGGMDNRSIAGRVQDDARPRGPDLTELVNLRLAQLEDDLNLRNNQLAAWKSYRDRVVQLLDDVRRAPRVSANETTAPQRLDALTDIARNRLTATEDIAEAGKALYAVLTPEQKAVADRRLALPLATLAGQETGADRARPDGTPAMGPLPTTPKR